MTSSKICNICNMYCLKYLSSVSILQNLYMNRENYQVGGWLVASASVCVGRCVFVCLYCSKGHVDLHCPTCLDSYPTVPNYYSTHRLCSCVVVCMLSPARLQLLNHMLVSASSCTSSEQLSLAESLVTPHSRLPLLFSSGKP